MNTNDIAQEAITLLGNYLSLLLIGGGGGAAVAFLIFRTLGSQWLENKFAKDIECHKYQLNSLHNRISKIHDKEIEILPTAWSMLRDALFDVGQLVLDDLNYYDISGISEDKLPSFLDKINLEEVLRERILHSSDKAAAFQQAMYLQSKNDALTKLLHFHQYLTSNSIFFSQNLYVLFRQLDDILINYMAVDNFGVPAKEAGITPDDYEKLQDETAGLLIEIEKAIQKRLHHSEAT